MTKKLLFTIISAALISTAFLNVAHAQNPDNPCVYTAPDEVEFGAKLISVRRKLRVTPGEEFRVKVFLRNTGNTPWFSVNSSCNGPKMSLGTDRPKDRKSNLQPTTITDENNWKKPSRIYMDQLRTDPGEIASFTFWAKAPQSVDVYKEYLTPLIEGKQWLDNAGFSYEVFVGKTGDSPKILRQKLSFASTSGSVKDLDLDAPRSIVVDVSDQTLSVKLGDVVVRQFPVSTGKTSTPTPYGDTQITLKQEVRIAHKYPHYIMPKFMMFRAGGYGLHALPSLGNDRGVFWTEARNHMGIPVSHGCIRLLPEDADFLFDFTPIGTPVTVQP